MLPGFGILLTAQLPAITIIILNLPLESELLFHQSKSVVVWCITLLLYNFILYIYITLLQIHNGYCAVELWLTRVLFIVIPLFCIYHTFK